MAQPKTREVSWLMMTWQGTFKTGKITDDTVWLCLEADGKQKRYSINGNQFREQLSCLKRSGFKIRLEDKMDKQEKECPICDGYGMIDGDTPGGDLGCSTCKGTGKVKEFELEKR